MLKDYEIAHQKNMRDIRDVAKKIGLSEEDLVLYGKYKAKVKDVLGEEKGKIILVTAINPTPLGEGKTTVAIGLQDAFWRLGEKSVLTLREPSMGPVFGIKGGATGGGYAQVVPMDDINLHFTGDFHAITSANNLISAMIDNHLKQGNALKLDVNKIYFERTIDMNDRALRNVEIGLGGKANGIPRLEHFTITAASEMMAIFCVSKDLKDLRRRIDQIIIGENIFGEFVTVKDLGITGSVMALLKDAMNPNLVQTLEGNPVLIHGGPFANIAPGVNSVRALKLARKLSRTVITEAGFGSDLGGFKFLDMICRTNPFELSAVVLVVTVKALKYHGGMSLEHITEENLHYLKQGMSNLEAHMEHLNFLNVSYVVTLNRYETDTEDEITMVRDFVSNQNVPFVVNEVYSKGGEGALSLAKLLLDNQTSSFHYIYEENDAIKVKIEKVCRVLLHAKEVTYSSLSLEKMKRYEKDFGTYPICIAKTQYSLSDDPNKLGYPKDFTVTVRDLHVCAGAEFIVVYLGNIMTMPGLPREAAAKLIDVDDAGNIVNLF